MNTYQLTYSRFSETTILVEWPQYIAHDILEDILIFKTYLLQSNSEPILHITSAYCSMLISYKLYIAEFESEVSLLKTNYRSRKSLGILPQKVWTIPVCYDSIFGVDLEEIAKEKNLPTSEVVRLHSEAIYKVYFIGFLPGFLYLGGLDKRLYIPRKTSPRQHIQKGAVGIGGEQTGIYPNASPGGWNIIGNSPLVFFNPKMEVPCFVSPGDNIHFVAVTHKAHQEISSQIKNGTYSMESEVRYG